MTILSLVNIVTVKNVIPLIPPILSLNKRSIAKKILSKNVSSNIRKPQVTKRLNFVIHLWFVRVKVLKNAGLFMSLNAKQGDNYTLIS